MLNLRHTYYIDLWNMYPLITDAYKKYYELHTLKHLRKSIKYQTFKDRIRARKLSVYDAINLPNTKKRKNSWLKWRWEKSKVNISYKRYFEQYKKWVTEAEMLLHYWTTNKLRSGSIVSYKAKEQGGK